MRQALYTFLLGMAMVACTGGHGVKHVAQPSDTLYTEPKAMSLHRTEPERALLMIDSAIIVGNIGKTVDCDRMMSAAYHYMGEFDRFDKAMRRFENDYPDTINAYVIICLEQRSEACEMQGRTAEALHYMQRAKVIRDSLDYRNQRDQLNELATLYHLQEEQLTRQEAEAAAFLLGEHARFITGTDLLIDGGVIASIRTGEYQLG